MGEGYADLGGLDANQAGCKRLHRGFGPSWAVRLSGRAKSRIRSTSDPLHPNPVRFILYPGDPH